MRKKNITTSFIKYNELYANSNDLKTTSEDLESRAENVTEETSDITDTSTNTLDEELGQKVQQVIHEPANGFAMEIKTDSVEEGFKHLKKFDDYSIE